MNKKIVISVLIVIAIIFGIYYFSKTSTTLTNTQNQTPVTQVPANTNVNVTTPALTYNVSISNFAFNPNTITINKGDTIVWTNNDSAPHQIKGDSNGLNSLVMSNGQTYSFTFNDIGTFDYHCVIHPMMKANIIVK